MSSTVRATARGSSRLRGAAIALRLVLPFVLMAAQVRAQEDQTVVPFSPASSPPASPVQPPCDNAELTAYDGLLVVAPHPDDETLAFAGLITAYTRQDKPVQVVVVTDGDANCDACRFWKNTSLHGPTCNALDLSNFATPAVDSFAEVRRGESASAAAVLGGQPPTFLGYPDTGLGAAWLNSRTGRLAKRLRRSDFSRCTDCESCQQGYGEGPATELTASTLIASLSSLLAATSKHTLVATTHWLDGHPDHAALGNFIKTINDRLAVPRPVLYAVIHAHTPKETPHDDCWYPGPQALACPCADEERAIADPTYVSELRQYRSKPTRPAALPDDAPYGPEKQFCLPKELYLGKTALKMAAIEQYRSQLGSLARTGIVPTVLDAIIDCNGYLISFVRRTEAFVLTNPAVTSAGCDLDGSWEGYGGTNADGLEVSRARLLLTRTGTHNVTGSFVLGDRPDGERIDTLIGESDGSCAFTLRVPQHPQQVYHGLRSRDGRSLYGSWGPERPGFFVVHR